MKNALQFETSPYLLQHADNPVQWYPWGDEALQLAREQSKPILLSVGYSACHWCHVMAHESFENAQTAQLMNDYFINIKVDREERPDLDKIYQAAQQMMSQRSGGWPLTMFLTPEQLPFYGGTYFPPEPRHGLISFPDLLTRVHELYHKEPERIAQQLEMVQQNLQQMNAAARPFEGEPDPVLLEKYAEELLSLFDPADGGFGRAPKFPQAAMLQLGQLLATRKTPLERLPQAIRYTLQKMARGGLQDHVMGGFFRYSVDERWMIPHFEKMLYDNGQMLALYARAQHLVPDPLFAVAMHGIQHWLKTEMQFQNGPFYAALDADSEGEEGKFYVWQRRELKRQLSAEMFEFAQCAYGLDHPANFEGQWHLHQYHNPERILQQLEISASEYERLRQALQQQLQQTRAQRIRPGLDNKILCSWNALVVEGLALSARLHQTPESQDMAEACLQWLKQNLYHEGRLQAVWRPGKKPLNGYLDDYAYLLQALLEMLQLRWNSADLDWAIALAETILEQFEDPEQGGFYYTSADHEELIQRPRNWQDEAVPNAAAVAAISLNRLGLLLAEPRYCEAASRALRSVYAILQRYPVHAPGFVRLLAELDAPPRLIILRAVEVAEAWQSLHQSLDGLLFCIPPDAADLPSALAEKSADPDQDLAWVCVGQSCYPPVTSPEQMPL